MKDVITFLYSIGVYNIIGGLFMFAMLNKTVAQKFCSLCEIFSESYTPTKESTLWLWWAALLNTLYGVAGVAATRWDVIAQNDYLLATIFMYSFFLILTFFAWRSPKYARGILINFPLFGFWLAWAIWVWI